MKGKTFINAMLRVLTVVMVLLSSVSFAIAQPGRFGGKMTVTGYILDSKTGESLIGATVQATSSDGGSGSFAITDENGKFNLEVPRPGKYTLQFNYVGYKELTKDVQIMPNRTNIGKFNLKEDPHMLAEVETVGHADRIKQRGDTLAYNADAYKVQDGATAEELVSKMPGIEVTSEGVKAQGETVQKILVDGKEFFDNDLRMALKSLPAEIIESVNIFDKKSDQAEFTGIDDGETVKAMDLSTKSWARNGVFGKVIGGGGNNFDFNNPYWNFSTNLNFNNGDQKLTIQAMSNNVNERNFSNDDMAGGMMGGRMWGSRGVARTNGVGINYTNVFLQNKLDVQMSYFFNQGRTVTADTTYTDDLLKGAANYSDSWNLSHSQSHRIGGRISYKPSANDEIMIRPSINFQSNDGNSISESRSWNRPLDDVTIDRNHTNLWDDVLSRSNNIGNNESDSWNVRANVLWRHRLNKPGRTLSVNANVGASGSESESRTNKDMVLGGIKRLDNQMNNSENNNSNFGGNIQYTEPLATGLNLSLRYDVSFNQSERDTKYTFFDNKDFIHNANDSLDMFNTNTYTQKNLRNSGEVGLNYTKGTLRINATARFQNSKLDGEQDYYLLSGADKASKNINTTKSYFSVLPNLRIEYRTAGGTQFRVNYRANASNPSINNLQESVNTTNPLSFSTGNANLDQSFSHNVDFNMIYTNTETAQNFMIFGGFNTTSNQIANERLYNRTKEAVSLFSIEGYREDRFRGLMLAPGGSITRPVNRDGSKSAHLNMGWGFPFDAIMSNVNISLGGNYSINPSRQLYWEETGLNPLETKTRSLGFNPHAHISSNISTDLNFNLMYMPSFQWVRDTQGNAQSRDYITHNLNANLNWTFWKGFTTEQVVNYSYNGGPAMPESIEQIIWNASVGKKFLKGNAAEIKLQAYDILGSNKGYNRSVGDSNITTSYRNFMPRYFMVTFTYKISAYRKGGKQSTKTDDGMGGFGGPGMMPPGGFGGGGFGGGRGGRF